MQSPRAKLSRTPSVSSATTTGQAQSEWGGSQATIAPGNTRQNTNAAGHIYIRFIDPENALSQKISAITAFPDPIPLRTKLSALRELVKTKHFGKLARAPFTVDLHLPNHPILTSDVDGTTLYDFDLIGTKRTPLNLFVCLRYTGNIGPATITGTDIRSTSNSNSWHPVERTTKAGISALCASLEILKRKLREKAMQRRFLTAFWQTTHFLPAVYAMGTLLESRSLTPEDKAALAQVFQAICVRSLPDWATGGKAENALEGSRQILGWLLDQVLALKRGGSGKEDWISKAIIKKIERQTSGEVTTENNIISIDLQTGEVMKVTVEFLDKSTINYPDSRQLALAYKDRYLFDGNSYLVLPKDAGNLLEHRILHHPTKEGFYEQIINTTNLPDLMTVAPLSLPTSRPPVLTLNNDGLVSIFEFGGECATEWARLWNPVTGTQMIISNDQGQGLAKTLQSVIKSRKLSGAWPLDGWDVGCLNASSVDTRKPKEAVMICIDCSSSMLDPAYPEDDANLRSNEKRSRMVAAKELFKAYAVATSNHKLPVHFGVMKFDASYSTMQDFTPLLDEVQPAIEKLYPAGMTAMWDCIYDAAEQLIDFKEDNPDTKLRIIVITDGIDNRSKQTDKSTYTLLWDNQIVLDAIVIGSEYFKSLFKICKATGGYAFKPSTPSENVSVADLETMLDQTRRPPIVRDAYLPYWDNITPQIATTVDAFTVPEARDHPNQNDEFMSLANANKAFSKHKQLSADKRAPADAARNRRMLLEIKDLAEDPHPDMDIYVSESNMSFWKVVIQGPQGSKYERGTFVMFLDMTEDFPARAPKARFITPIIHPNINKHGKVCHPILDIDWKAETKVRDILCCIYGLLMAPEANVPVDAVATMKYWTDENLYTKEISDHIRKFASTDRKDWAHRIVPDLDAIPGVTPIRATTHVRKVSATEMASTTASTSGTSNLGNKYQPGNLRGIAAPARYPVRTSTSTSASPPASPPTIASAYPPPPITTATAPATRKLSAPVPLFQPQYMAQAPVPAPPLSGNTYRQSATSNTLQSSTPVVSGSTPAETSGSIGGYRSASATLPAPGLSRFSSIKSTTSNSTTTSQTTGHTPRAASMSAGTTGFFSSTYPVRPPMETQTTGGSSNSASEVASTAPKPTWASYETSTREPSIASVSSKASATSKFRRLFGKSSS